MISPEEIAEFERRADSGEEPVMPWTEEDDGDFKTSLGWCSAWIVRLNKTRWRFAGHNGPLFSSRKAACLAAEHLLRVATLPLHAKGADNRG